MHICACVWCLYLFVCVDYVRKLTQRVFIGNIDRQVSVV